MKYIKKLSVIAVAALVLVSGFAVVAEKSGEGAFKPEKIFAQGKREFKKFDKKNFKRPKMKKVELTEEEKAAKLEEFKAKLAENLASGKIPQEQYDKMLSSFESGKFKPFNKPVNGKRRQFRNHKVSKPLEEKVIKE